MSTDSTQRGLPEFKTRRSTAPTVVTSFAQQLDAQRAAAPPRGVQRLSSRPSVTAVRHERTLPTGLAAPTARAARGGQAPAMTTAGRPAGLALVAPRAEVGAARAGILERAERLLDVPYVWGGDTTSGLDCSAYLSRVWGVSRQTTDTLQNVADPIDKKALKPGDALNLPTWKDPSRHGHVRLFDGWADAAKTKMWVYEETADTGKSVHRVIGWDDRYQPMRLRGLD
jgi:cell wall-associated NlpC family hydrolase